MESASRTAYTPVHSRSAASRDARPLHTHDLHRIAQHLRSPVDPPTWGPDWIKKARRWRNGFAPQPAPQNAADEHRLIVDNLEKSRQVARYKGLYIMAAVLSLIVCGLAMFVDYQIINGDVWTRALANEYMQVPDALKDSVIFKSLQVIFAVLAIHFMLKITGKFGRTALISIAFVLTIVMIGCLGYLVAYNNMDMGTSARLERSEQAPGNAGSDDSTIDRLLHSIGGQEARAAEPQRPVNTASAVPTGEVSLPLPKLSEQSLANAQGWFWLAFASVIFFIVTAVCALYMQIAENNIRNWHIARDYKTRRREYDLLARSGRV
jgi:hypothetical protein